MAEYWFISAPGKANPKREFERVQPGFVADPAQGGIKYLALPKELKVGTLDTLIGLSDDLIKIDSFVESVVFKLAQYISELNNAQGAKLNELLKSQGRTLANFVGNFNWDTSKFNTGLPVKQITEDISKRVSAIESDMKTKITAYSKAKSNLQAAERKTAGSLLIRGLDDLVKKSQFVQDSEYLTTLLVVVPQFSIPEWQATYSTLTDFIVPNSTDLIGINIRSSVASVPSTSITSMFRLVFQDNEYALFTVTLFQRVVDEFKLKAREKRFIVRDFTYDATQVATAAQEKKDLEEDYSKKQSGLALWCTSQFSEVFTCWIHIKALRLFVESVLRFGLPVDIMCAIVEAKQRGSKKYRTILEQSFGGAKSAASNAGETMEIAGVTQGQQEYFPYVNFTIDLSRILQTN